MTINFQKRFFSKAFKTFTCYFLYLEYYVIDFSFEVFVFSEMKK